MSEKLLALLFRLYPPAFRERYLDEAIVLCRDRRRNETGIYRRLRLACDLLIDFSVSLPRAWQTSFSEIASAPSPVTNAQGAPSFPSLRTEHLRPSVILLGIVFSIAALGGFVLFLRTTALYPLERHEPSAIETVLHRLNQPVRAASQAYADSDAIAAQAPTAALPQDATQAMIAAIHEHPIVMFGETHGNKQEYEWLCRLVKTPAFANQVDDIVVEFGNSLYQKSVDRYIAGEDVSYAQVEKAWRNMIGSVGPVSPVYADFYQAVRASNLQRRGGHQIRLLLGDPYGDWEKINNAEDLGPYLAHRDEWYATVVKDEVLAHHHRALLIMGAGHFLRRQGPGQVEQKVREAGVKPWLVVLGTNAVGGYDDLDHRFDAWPLPAIADLSNSWVADLPANPVLTGGVAAASPQKMKDVADAMLYVGSRDSLTQLSLPQSELANTPYGKEIQRRLQIQMGRTMDFTGPSEAPQYQKPAQQSVSNGIHRLPPNPPKSANDPLPPRPPSQ